jgi:RHS repeat-associated protein
VSWLRDKPITLYASADGGTYYRLPDSPRKIGHIEAWFYGLPTMLSRYILMLLSGLTLAVLLGPSSIVLYQRLRRVPRGKRPRLSVYQRTICLFLAWVFLIGPECFRQAAYADSQYEQVSTFTWADGNYTIEYGYDDNGSLTSQVTVRRTGPETTEFVEGRRYEYNLQNRLARLWDAGDDELLNTADDVLLAEYRYNPQGMRIEKINCQTSPVERTTYLIDPANPTGYAQVLEETTYEDDGQGGWALAFRIHYCIGDDVLAQTRSTWDTDRWTASATDYLLYDGHGSTRQLAGSTQIIRESYHYDGYGTLLQDSSAESDPGVTPAKETSILYAGEQFDTTSQFYNNRARWYNPLNGRFNRVDPFSGNLYDPQSLHKYLYCHANPVNSIDPTGFFEFSMVELVSVSFLIGTIAYGIATTVYQIKGHAFNEATYLAVKWFWVGAVAGAVLYGGIWATHSILVVLYGPGAGLGGLEYARQYGIQSYDELRSILSGTGLQAHHIIEQRFAQTLGLKGSEMASVALTPAEHQVFTNAWRSLIPYSTGAGSYINISKQTIWEAAKQVYADYPALLDAAKATLGI